jgi:hypothetical protein
VAKQRKTTCNSCALAATGSKKTNHSQSNNSEIECARENLKRLERKLAPFEFTWEQWRRIAEFVGKTDFGCDFRNERCKVVRKRHDPEWRTMKCCCADCAEMLGYLERIPPGTANTIAELFHPKTGFWRRGVGCVLPHEWRDPVCLRYACTYDLDEDWVSAIGDLRRILSGGLRVRGKRTRRRLPIVRLEKIKRTLVRFGAFNEEKTNSRRARG